MNNISDKIYESTDNGLDIIKYYYPQAFDSVGKPNKAFKLRDETAPSAYLKQIKGIWRVTDFGEDQHARSPIDIVMREENVEFNEAISILVNRYNIDNRLDSSVNKADIECRPAKDDEPDGFFDYEIKQISDSELKILGNGVKENHADMLNFSALSWYLFTKNRKTTIIRSNENFPIFMRECHTNEESFYKILKPMEPNKAYRFMYLGKKAPDYINGLYELKRQYEEFLRHADDDEEEEDGKKKKSRLGECVICSGERDAICCLSRGYQPIWLNSETAELKPSVFKQLLSMCEKVYNLPDIDTTGKKRARALALKYLELYTIELPDSLLEHRDQRGNPLKDMRDFCQFHSSARDFEKLVNTARQCKFWYEEKTKVGVVTKLDVVNLLYFLHQNGYARLVDEQDGKERIIHVTEDNIVSDVTENSIINFLQEYCEKNYLSLEVRKSLISSRFVKNVFNALPIRNNDIDFTNCTPSSQRFRFDNCNVEVFADDIKPCSSFHIMKQDVIRHNFKRLAPSFTVEMADGKPVLNIHNTASCFFRFCINSSRLYWQEEIANIDNEDNRKMYLKDHHFCIDSPMLSKWQIEEQTQCLMAKMYAIGYLLHSYKDPSTPFIVWILENNILNDDSSSGGSGKSFIGTVLKFLKHMVTLDGRNKHLTENQHYLERIDETTDLLLVDDAVKYFDFDSFYTLSTGTLVVNAKHSKSKEIDFDHSPKVIITSNFAPNRADESTIRRILFVPMSDWYHQRTEFNNYEETRRISDDFGYNLYSQDYTSDQWNTDFNFLIDCLQFFLSMKKTKTVVTANLANIYSRINLSIMGEQFNEWAEGFFMPGGPNLDIMIRKSEVFNDFVNTSGLKNWSSSKFSRALLSFCRNNDYIECLNPPELCPESTPGRIVQREGSSTVYYIYVKTKGTPINNNKKEYYE